MRMSSINLSTTDLYYICQMVDGVTSDPGAWIRRIEDFAGDMFCQRLLGEFPKWTPLHEFIEFVVLDVVYEDIEKGAENLLIPEESRLKLALKGRRLWLDFLFESNNFSNTFRKHVADGGSPEVSDYFDDLGISGEIQKLLEMVSRQVFHVLFQNRKVLKRFNSMLAYHVKETGPHLFPDAYGPNGSLKRKRPPQWAKDAVFHRDKGCCVFCGTDLARLVNQREAIHYDHIVPLADGGMNDVTNLQLLCSGCNLTKGSRNRETSYRVDEWYTLENE